MKNDRLANELNQLTQLYKELVVVAEDLRSQGDRKNSQAVQNIAFGLQNSQLNILTSLVKDPSRNKNVSNGQNSGIF